MLVLIAVPAGRNHVGGGVLSAARYRHNVIHLQLVRTTATVGAAVAVECKNALPLLPGQISCGGTTTARLGCALVMHYELDVLGPVLAIGFPDSLAVNCRILPACGFLRLRVSGVTSPAQVPLAPRIARIVGRIPRLGARSALRVDASGLGSIACKL